MSHFNIRLWRGQNYGFTHAESKRRAELAKRYFTTMKISTQVLISVWKMKPAHVLTSLPSMA